MKQKSNIQNQSGFIQDLEMFPLVTSQKNEFSTYTPQN